MIRHLVISKTPIRSTSCSGAIIYYIDSPTSFVIRILLSTLTFLTVTFSPSHHPSATYLLGVKLDDVVVHFYETVKYSMQPTRRSSVMYIGLVSGNQG